ncbi:pyridoxamine 5'-phosphate oxidase-like FMN-binding protein [Oleiphilus messinensis]|uniref:Pyridoxamine 5'-phosphate oxidase-like FMN-binding protein n=1 Tax=Oleiphilus messinensis TaxID=141451 RepID=A0A1Y0I8J7_9GAMM|nr:pyridoxamine 5'-phosphate oxidase family protein [Oleiphilus messinensis]ARU56781.1 pyridoxamine 5'-phosphate oxidase-like FMN-binding protein [Oleiphilus messinensis]
MTTIRTIEALQEIYGEPLERALWKEIDHINPHYQKFIEKSPFLILSTRGEQGIDCSPRGDAPGFVRVIDEKHIQIPDRRGNNRVDSLRNIVTNPEVGLLFLIPNVGETIRLSGKAEIIADDTLCQSFAVQGKPASTVLSISVDKVYYQCQKAIVRSGLWNPENHINRDELPTAGAMAKVFSTMRNIDFDAEEYDKNYPEYMKKTIY